MNGDNTVVSSILIVEDELPINRFVAGVLTGEGYKVDVAINGTVALSKLKEKEYDLLIVDIRMPEMNGIELYQEICQKYPELIKRIILASGDVLNGETRQFFEKNGNIFLEKPFNTEELLAVVKQTL